jgi:hypothetical protein
MSTTQSPAAQPGSAGGAASSGAAQSKDGLHPAQRDPEPARTQSEQNENEQERAGSGGQSDGGGTADGTILNGTSPNGESKAGGSILSLSPEEIEKIRRVIASYSIAPPKRANFRMRIGALVPGNVDLKPIPPELKGVIPDHQNFSYVRTPGRIAIVLTDKREIDVLIPG